MENQKKYYDDFFKTFGPNVHLDPVRFSAIASLARGSVLDCGCGTGNLSDFYSGAYTGVDISDVAIASARLLRRQTAYFCVKELRLFFGLNDKKFDTVVFAEILEHIDKDDWLDFVVKNVVNSNGRIIVSVPNGDRVPDESHLRTFTVPELRKKFSHFGRVRFHNWSGFSNRILMTCDVGEKNPDLLSLAMVVKNEGLGLENAILSCIEFVDCIVINVDDASTDETLKIAKLYADYYNVFSWSGSFSHSRNLVQSCVITPWVLSLDGHEYVVSTGNLEKALQSDYDSFAVQITLESGFSFLFPRLIRCDVKWQNEVHNDPIVKNMCGFSGFAIKHDRAGLQSKESAAARDAQRNEMILRIMNAKLKKDRKDIVAWFYLGQHYSYIHEHRKAIKHYRKYLKYSTNKQERWIVWWEIASIYMLTNRYTRATIAFNNANKELPGRWEIAFSLGVAWVLVDAVDISLQYFVKALQRNNEVYMYNPLIFDEARIFNYIGAGLHSKGKFAEAKISWRRALEVELKKPEKEQDINFIEVLKRMTV